MALNRTNKTSKTRRSAPSDGGKGLRGRRPTSRAASNELPSKPSENARRDLDDLMLSSERIARLVAEIRPQTPGFLLNLDPDTGQGLREYLDGNKSPVWEFFRVLQGDAREDFGRRIQEVDRTRRVLLELLRRAEIWAENLADQIKALRRASDGRLATDASRLTTLSSKTRRIAEGFERKLQRTWIDARVAWRRALDAFGKHAPERFFKACEDLYVHERNPLFAWLAYDAAREWERAAPTWVADYLAQVSDHLLELVDSAPRNVPTAAARALGFTKAGAHNVFRSFANQLRDYTLAWYAHQYLQANPGASLADAKREIATKASNPKGRGGLSEATVGNAHRRYRGLLRALPIG